MDKLIINGGKKLKGKIAIKSAKNSVLPILSACLLCSNKVVLHNIPKLSDIDNMCDILRHLGGSVRQHNGDITIDCSRVCKVKLPSRLTQKLRASVLMLGSLVATKKKAQISTPGGCNIGARPIDITLDGLKSFGTSITSKNGYITCKADSIKPSKFCLHFPSVGATENLMLASVFVSGETILQNCAKEPEIVDLQNFLNTMGAKISGAGTSQIKIVGVKNLHGGEYTPIGDRIVAGTYMLATMICGGNVELTNIQPQNLSSLINLFDSNDCQICCKNDTIKIIAKKRLKSIPFVKTSPYPLFPTDLQPQLMALQCVSHGTSEIVETIFESRLKHVDELIKMGAKISVKQNRAIVCGTRQLHGANVVATDLRAGASLVLAGLNASGTTTICGVSHIDRGYENIQRDLKLLGADIERVSS